MVSRLVVGWWHVLGGDRLERVQRQQQRHAQADPRLDLRRSQRETQARADREELHTPKLCSDGAPAERLQKAQGCAWDNVDNQPRSNARARLAGNFARIMQISDGSGKEPSERDFANQTKALEQLHFANQSTNLLRLATSCVVLLHAHDGDVRAAEPAAQGVRAAARGRGLLPQRRARAAGGGGAGGAGGGREPGEGGGV